MSDYIVSATSSALRRDPSHESEQISRLLLGERFNVTREADEGRWAYGAGPDGYEGWLRTWHLVAGKERPKPDRSVSARWSRALSENHEGAEILLDLSFGTGLLPSGEAQDGFIPWTLPDGRSAWTPVDDLEPTGSGGLVQLIERGRRLLGVPYEWGGRSSAGLDCSGFIQLLFGGLGIDLPRDAHQQAECGCQGPLEDLRLWLPGDLIFYGPERIEHVGLWLGRGRLLHASGHVRIEELDAKGQLPGDGRPALAARSRILSTV